jgi:hypothetical protein
MNARDTLTNIGVDTSDITYDPWGTAMSALWDISHAIEHYGALGEVPAAWGFVDSWICSGLLSSKAARQTGEDQTARSIAAAILRHPDTERAVVRAGNILDRYIGIMDRAGRSY